MSYIYRSIYTEKCKILKDYGIVDPQYSAGYHTGLDVYCSNPKIVSPCDGVIQSVNSSGNSYGNHCVISATNGWSILLAHMADRPLLRPNTPVTKGAHIGTQGSSGNSSTPHCHIEITTKIPWTYAKNDVNPALYIDLNDFSGNGGTPENPNPSVPDKKQSRNLIWNKYITYNRYL